MDEQNTKKDTVMFQFVVFQTYSGLVKQNYRAENATSERCFSSLFSRPIRWGVFQINIAVKGTAVKMLTFVFHYLQWLAKPNERPKMYTS